MMRAYLKRVSVDDSPLPNGANQNETHRSGSESIDWTTVERRIGFWTEFWLKISKKMYPAERIKWKKHRWTILKAPVYMLCAICTYLLRNRSEIQISQVGHMSHNAVMHCKIYILPISCPTKALFSVYFAKHAKNSLPLEVGTGCRILLLVLHRLFWSNRQSKLAVPKDNYSQL